MRRSIGLGMVTIVGVFATMTTYEARQARASLTVYEIADNLYMLANASSVQGMGGGGNTAIFVTDDGVALVDTKIKGYGQDILAEVRKITDKPVTTIINTHTHWDHTGSNTEFPDTVDFVVHENTRGHMASQDCDDGAGFEGGSIKNCDAFTGANAKYLPGTTYSDTLTLFSGADQIDLYHFGRGHTDGDTFVVFRAARAMHTGDMFQRLGLPFIDVPNSNGSAIEFGETLKKAVAGISNVDTVIPGHNPTAVTWNDFVNFSGFYNDVVMKTQQAKAAGRSVDDIVSSYSVPSEYSDFSAPQASLRTTVQYVFDGQ
ncbi:MAG: MBL fold metallo-hydrolase [Acidobacteria bacterium]|nr:MBL fold metallo-hydrolase [Acidobacteriota bacterium]